MRKKGDIVRYTAEQLQAMRLRGEDRTEWAKVDAMTEDALEASIAADPDDIHEEPDWNGAFKGLPPIGNPIPVLIDRDVLDWFKASGTGYRARINQVLRAHVDVRRKERHKR